MKLAQVGKYLPEGVRAMSNLMNMMIEAAHACGFAVVRSANWDDIGIKLDGQKYWLGVNYAEPEKLWFGTRTQIDRDKVAVLGEGESLSEEDWVPGRLRWWRGAELESEDVRFFLRSKVGQMEWLMAFIRACVAKARDRNGQPTAPPADRRGRKLRRYYFFSGAISHLRTNTSNPSVWNRIFPAAGVAS